MPAKINLDIEKVIKLYEDGNSSNKIANTMNVSKRSILRILNKNNVKMRHHEFNEKLIIELYETKTIIEISKILHMGTVTISKILKKNNIQFKNTINEYKEKDIINLYNKGYGCTTIGKSLNISKSTVLDYLRKHKINPDHRPYNKNVNEIIKLYNEKKSILIIANKLEVGCSVIRRILTKNNIIIRKAGSNRKILVNDGAFNELSPESCYWAGFIAADGNVRKNVLSIGLKYSDFVHLEKFKKFVDTSAEIKLFSTIKHKQSKCVIRFSSKQIINSLKENFNIIPVKSLILQPPNINNEELIKHFIRGYFDGDGCIYIKKTGKKIRSAFSIYSGSYNIIKWIYDHLKINLDIGNPKITKEKGRNLYKFTFGGNRQVPKIMNWLYKDCKNAFLDRKYIKFNTLLCNINGGKYGYLSTYRNDTRFKNI